MNENDKYELLQDNNLITIRFFPGVKLLSLVWHKDIKTCALDILENLLDSIKSIVKNKMPGRLFNDMSDFAMCRKNFSSAMALLENFFNAMPFFSKEAYLLPVTDVITHMSITHILDDRFSDTQIFLDSGDAMDWLLQ